MSGRSVQRGEKGFYFIVGAVLIVLLMIVAAIIFGLGRITADKARLQAINNLIAMAAIEAFMNCTSDTVVGKDDEVPGCTAATYAGKTNAAIVASNKFAALNELQGAGASLGDLELEKDDGTAGLGGAVAIGRWFPEDNGEHLCTKYPCFVRNSSSCSDLSASGCGVNAIRVKINTQPGNSIRIPLGKFLDSESAAINTVATSSVIPRCAAFVLDVSGSSSAETHLSFKNATDKNDFSTYTPDYPSSFSVRSWPATGDPATSAFNCASADTSRDASHWCFKLPTYPTLMSRFVTRNQKFDGNPFKHFQSDYINTDSDLGETFGAIETHGAGVTRPRVLFDRFVDLKGDKQYEGPQPLVSFLKAFNAGIQQMRRQAVGGDEAAVIGFSTSLVQNAVADSARALSSNFGFLMQLTNPDNRGTYSWDEDDNEYEEETDEVRPNFLDAGWYPHFEDTPKSGTNLYSSLVSAVDSLASCPVSSKKMIIVATDGIPNCLDGGGCGDTYANYMANENKILDMNSGSLLSNLIQSKIAVTVLLRGKIVKPNFLNILSPTTNKAMTQSEARALGYGGPLAPTGKKFFYYTSGFDSTDFINKSEDFPFLRPNGLMGDLAFRTGGIFCPLQDKLPDDDPAYEEVNGIPTLKEDTTTRVINDAEYRPLYNLSIGGQATKCIKDAIGGIPFTLVEGTNVDTVPPTPTP